MHIYKTICLINNKIYIGQTTRNEYTNYLGSGTKLIDCLKKFGSANFKREVLKVCNTQAQLDFWEEYYIKKYNSCNENIGYNILKGTANGFKSGAPMLNKDVAKKVSNTRKGMYTGSQNSNFGNKWSDEKKADLRNKMIGRYDGDKNPNFGNKWSEEKREELSKKKSKIILQINSNGEILGEFVGSTKASVKLGIKRSNICNSIKRNCKANGFYFKYKE